MKKGNISSASVKKVKKNYFTGPVTLHDISSITKPSEHDLYHVIFKKSARTKIHYHTGAQMLIVTKGHGSLVYYKKIGNGASKFKISKTKTISLNSGDIVYIQPKMLHTHGSVRKDTIFSHLALNFYHRKNVSSKTIWYESDLRSNLASKITWNAHQITFKMLIK